MKTIKKQVIEVEHDEFENKIKKFYGVKEFSFVADQESGNDTIHEFSVSNPPDYVDEEGVEKLRETGEYCFLSESLLNDMCEKGEIEPGDYIISVCW